MKWNLFQWGLFLENYSLLSSTYIMDVSVHSVVWPLTCSRTIKTSQLYWAVITVRLLMERFYKGFYTKILCCVTPAQFWSNCTQNFWLDISFGCCFILINNFTSFAKLLPLLWSRKQTCSGMKINDDIKFI